MENETLDLINRRVSLRKFADQEITVEERKAIIGSAMRAPTAGNMMLYSIITVDEQEKKEKLSKTCDNQPFIARAPLVMIFLADFQRWYDYYDYCNVEDYCQRRGMEFSGPSEADLLLGCCDALIAAQNAVLAAESMNIGSCYIGDIMENYETHCDLLNLPPLVFPITMLVFGHYPEKRPEIRPRFDKKYIVFQEKYRRLEEGEFSDMYSDHSISPHNKFEAENFGQYMYARKTGADFSIEMARSVRKALENWGGKVK